jgi:hypothetical protein
MLERYSRKESTSENPVGKVLDYVRHYFQDGPLYQRPDVQQTVKAYLRAARELILQGLLLLLVTEALFLLIISFCKGFTEIYASTYIGRQMLSSNSLLAMYFADFAKIQPLEFTLEIVTVTLLAGLTVGILFRFFQLTESFYFSHGFLGRALCFVPLIGGIVSFFTSTVFELHWHIVFAASLIPALCLLNYCFIFSYEIFPEAGSLLRPWLHLSLAWEIFHRSLLNFLVVVGASIASFLLFEWVVDESGDVGSYLPTFLYEVFDLLDAMSVLQSCFFIVKLSLALYVTGVLIGVLVQLLTLFHLFEKLKFRLQLVIAGGILSVVFFQFRHGFVDLESSLAVLTVIGIPAFSMAVGCMHIGHSLVVNISFLGNFEGRIQRWIGLTPLAEIAGKFLQRSVKEKKL